MKLIYRLENSASAASSQEFGFDLVFFLNTLRLAFSKIYQYL